MHETSKAIRRRLHDVSFATRYFVGSGIDIGAGNDSLAQYTDFFPLISAVRSWDMPDGDAQKMEGCADEAFDFVHSSHCLEHMRDPHVALANWFRILKPGGHLVALVPDEDMYEQGMFPSTFNSDHKWTFTVMKDRSWSNRSCNLVDMLRALGPAADVVKIEQLTGTYRFGQRRIDQTANPIGEAAIEIILRKRLPAELAEGGCIGPARRGRQRDVEGLTPVNIYRNINKARHIRLRAAGTAPYSVVIPHATYSPWLEASGFLPAYQAVREHTLVDLYRCYELWSLVQQLSAIPGDVLEVGTWRGGSGCLLGLAMREAGIDATLWLADTFAGVVKAGARDPDYKGGEHAETSVEIVAGLLTKNGINNARILRGVFPEQTGAVVTQGPLRLCHIDVDAHQSAKDVLDWAWPRLAAGGVVVFDDYGFSDCEGITTLVNERRGRADTMMLHNLNGHAVLLKRA